VIDAARRAHIRHLFYVEHWKIRTISAQLGVHRNTVYRAIASDGVSAGSPVQPARLDRDTGPVGQTLEPHPRDGRQLARLEVAP
jgi:hypothetical protein